LAKLRPIAVAKASIRQKCYLLDLITLQK
jgi:hypothetical protein